MSTINDSLIFLDGFLGGAFWFPYFLLGSGLFFTLFLGFPQIKYFLSAWKVLFHKRTKEADGETSHFQALATALSGTVGTGNIGGVGLAIFLGGPAALFWMWVTAFLGMATKFVEVTLSHKYRIKTEDGTVAGGPMYFMDRKLNWKPVAIIFAIATVASSFGSGSFPQINNIAHAMNETFGINKALIGAIMAAILGLVIIGGIRRIALFTSSILPIMAFLYLIGAFAVIITNYQNVIPSFIAVFSDAFTGSAAAGGFLGASFAYAFNRGVNRGLFSNEAGQGSAPIAHASAQTKEPVSEGLVSLLEPFIDTIIICTITGLVILSSGVWTQKIHNQFQQSDMVIISGQYSDQVEEDRKTLYQFINKVSDSKGTKAVPYSGQLTINEGKIDNQEITIINARSVAKDVFFYTSDSQNSKRPYNGQIQVTKGRLSFDEFAVEGKSLLHSAALTSKAFTISFFGEYGRYIVTIALLLFAFSTAISWSYYGDRAMIYLVGSKGILPYRLVYIVAFFIASFTDTIIIWNFAAITIVLMTIPNLIALFMMSNELKSTVNDYIQR